MDRNPRRNYKTYTMEELGKALKYIQESEAQDYEFQGPIVNDLKHGNIRKVIAPPQGTFPLVPSLWVLAIREGGREDFISCARIGNLNSEPKLRKLIEKLNSATFEGWCPEWEGGEKGNIKPAKK